MRRLTAWLIALFMIVTLAALPKTAAAAAEVQHARVGNELTYSEWCWERPGVSMLQIKRAGHWRTVARATAVVEEECDDADYRYSATLRWTPDAAGTFAAREYRPTSAGHPAESARFTLKIAGPAPIKVKLGKRFTRDYCLPDPGHLKLQVRSSGRWKTIDTTAPRVDRNACDDPHYPYSARLTWKPSRTGTFTLRVYQSATPMWFPPNRGGFAYAASRSGAAVFS